MATVDLTHAELHVVLAALGLGVAILNGDEVKSQKELKMLGMFCLGQEELTVTAADKLLAAHKVETENDPGDQWAYEAAKKAAAAVGLPQTDAEAVVDTARRNVPTA